ncbi:DUF2059 domain-containing protein [Pontibacterium sp.]|uniref:DUF2059 domain-containing protein n=1 Tax=Pontibacterium sp. TaxID=2036026 RepID=UPI0035188357
MKKLLPIGMLLLSINAYAEPIDELIEIVGGKNQIQQMHNQMIEIMAASNPQLANHRAVIKAWADKYFTWEELKPGMVQVYKKYYSDAEIVRLLEFYKSPVGRKSVELMPVMFSEGGKVGQQVALKYQPQLIEMLQADQLNRQ